MRSRNTFSRKGPESPRSRREPASPKSRRDSESLVNRITKRDVVSVRNMLQDNDVIAVLAPTGSGKTTILVPELYKLTDTTIFVVETTIPSVRETTKRVKTVVPSNLVGSAAESIKRYENEFLDNIRLSANSSKSKKITKEANNNTTKIVYVTAKHMEKIFIDLIKYVNKFGANDTDVSFCDILIIDEAHNGTIEVEIIMALWKFLYDNGAVVPRLLLTSATLNVELSPFPAAPVYSIDVKSYPVQILYHDSDFSVTSESLLFNTVDVIVEKHLEDQDFKTDPKGSTWLVFCSGSYEVDKVVSLLRSKGDFLVVPAYSDMDSFETEKVFHPNPGYIRKIIVATNIAETSITIDDLSYVFDTMAEKIQETSISGGSKLELVNVSKASAKQRAGRTGRTCPGTVYRMCTKGFYESLPEQRNTEIERVPIFTTIIKLLDLELNPSRLFPGLSRDRINNAVKLLKDIDMIGKSETGIYKVHDKGSFGALFQFSVKLSGVLFDWIQSKLPIFPCLVVICLIDSFSMGYFYYPKKKPEDSLTEHQSVIEAHYEKYFRQFYHISDLGVLLNLFKSFIEKERSYDVDYRRVVEFSKDNSLNNKRFGDFLISLKQNIRTLEAQGYVVNFGTFNITNLLNKIQPYIVNVFKKDVYTKKDKSYYKDEVMYNLDRRNLLRIDETNYKKIIGLITYENSSLGNKTRRYITLSIPYDYEYSIIDEIG